MLHSIYCPQISKIPEVAPPKSAVLLLVNSWLSILIPPTTALLPWYFSPPWMLSAFLVTSSISPWRLLSIADFKAWSKGEVLSNTTLKRQHVLDITILIQNFSLKDCLSLSDFPSLHEDLFLHLLFLSPNP